MDDATRTMVKGWLASDRGDKERTARFIRRIIRCTIGEAREFVEEALS